MKLNNQLEDHLVEQATKRLSNELLFKLLSHWQSSRIFSSVLGKLHTRVIENFADELITKYAYGSIQKRLLPELVNTCYGRLGALFEPFLKEVSAHFDNTPKFISGTASCGFERIEFVRFANAFISIAKYDTELEKIMNKYNTHTYDIYCNLKKVIERENNVSE